LDAPEGWLNFDCSQTLTFERIPLLGRLYTKNKHRFPVNVRYGNIVKGLPIPEASCGGIFCCHMLEHLSLADFDRALVQTWRHLAPGGTFRLIVPDLEYFADAYLKETDPLAAIHFMKRTSLGLETRGGGLAQFLAAWLGNSAHLWMWDEKSLAHKLGEHGFRNIRRVQCGDAMDKRFNEVEKPDRFVNSVAMQCEK
jgi:SAM-dependent methyltransferase